MPQYAVLIYDVTTADRLPVEIQAAHAALPGRVAEAGGRIVAGMTLQGEVATSHLVEGEWLPGSYADAGEQLIGVFVLEARDDDHARDLAAMTPTEDGSVEVRPLIGFGVFED